jgi:anti-sigma factor ChrR (cupin superfamily)
MMIKIKSGNKIFALLLDVREIKEGSLPVTDPSWPIQMLLMNRKKGHIVAKHTHKKILKSTKQPQEALVVIKGAIEASIFDNYGKLIKKQKALPGQCLLIVDGGHEVKMSKNSLIYAFKDGPYVDDKISLS